MVFWRAFALVANTLTPYRVRARRRPLRVAYVCDVRTLTDRDLDSIRWEAQRTWAGRLSPIILFDESGIGSQDWDLLKAISPDVVVSNVELPPDLEARIRLELSPGFVQTESARNIRGLMIVLSPELLRRVESRSTELKLLTFRPVGSCDPVLRAFLDFNFGNEAPLHQRDGVIVEQHVIGGRSDLAKALRRLSSHDVRGSIYMAEASALPDHLPRSSRFRDTFAVVIGDSRQDIVKAWNYPLYSSKRNRLQSLWVPADLAKDSSLTDMLRSWLFYACARAYDANGRIRFTSASLNESELHAIADKLVLAPRGADLLDEGQVEYSPKPEHISELFRCSELVHRGLEPAEVLVMEPPEEVPEGTLASYWAADLLVGQEGVDKYWSRTTVWQLPKDEAASRCFLERGRIASSLRVPVAIMSASDPETVLRIPEDDLLFRSILKSWPPSGKSSRVRFEDCDLSDKGQYLLSMLDVFGGIGLAYTTLRSRFWRAVVEQMPAVLAKEASWTFEKLVAAAKRELEAFKKLRKENYPFEINRLTSAVEDLIERGVLILGADFECPSCRYSSWLPLESFSQVVSCAGCKMRSVFSPRQELGLRLNNLIKRGWEHDVVPVILAIGLQCEQSRYSFRFFPQMDVFESVDRGRCLTDIDILCVSDGDLILGEAKQRTEGFGEKDFENLKLSAGRLRPDRVMLFSVDGEPSEIFNERLEELRESLTSLGVQHVAWTRLPEAYRQPDPPY